MVGAGKEALLVGGDVHLYAESTVCRLPGTSSSDGRLCFPAIVTSGITRGSETITAVHLFLYQAAVSALTTTALVGPDGARWTSDTHKLQFTNNFAVVASDNTNGTLSYHGTVRPLASAFQRRMVLLFIEHGHVSMWVVLALILALVAAAMTLPIWIFRRLFCGRGSKKEKST